MVGTVASKVDIKKMLATLSFFKFFIFITFLIHFLFTPGQNGYNWGILHISLAGVHNGLLFSLRVGLLMWAAALFGWITSPVALADALEKMFAFLKWFRIPPRDVSMVVLLSMRFIPTIMDDAQKIRWAQMTRGGSLKGGIFGRVRQVVPMVIPLFISAFRRADKLALALELRGYDPHMPRTKLYDIKFRFGDWLVSIAAILVALFVIAIAI